MVQVRRGQKGARGSHIFLSPCLLLPGRMSRNAGSGLPGPLPLPDCYVDPLSESVIEDVFKNGSRVREIVLWIKAQGCQV